MCNGYGKRHRVKFPDEQDENRSHIFDALALTRGSAKETLALFLLQSPSPLGILSCVIGAMRKFYRSVIHSAQAQTPHVTQVVLVHLPGVAGTLTRHCITRALYVA